MNIMSCRNDCSGCGACYSVCPKHAIHMEPDQHGFIYPIIDEDKCIDCGLCVKKCPVAEKTEHTSITAFYGWNNDEAVRMRSSSGGLFSALADYVLSINGVVYGAVFDPKTKNVEYRGTDEVTLDDIRRSKYTECRTNDVFIKVRNALVQGKMVLFCGTPCHVAGLVNYLGKQYDNLITCDFVCGGAASPAFFKQHLLTLETKCKSRVSGVNFRDKKMGWKRMLFTAEFENGRKKSTLSYFDSYFNGFIEGIIKRENCFSCKFSADHYADITIADYWGYLKAGVPYDARGISMIIANTEHGLKLIQGIGQNVTLNEIGLERTKYTVQPRVFNQKKYDCRNAFFELVQSVGYEGAAKASYMKSPLKDLILSYIRR